jgi:hypothetical protein
VHVFCSTESKVLKFETEVFSGVVLQNPIQLLAFIILLQSRKTMDNKFFPVYFGFVAAINSLSDKANLWINSRNRTFSEFVDCGY